MGPIWGPQDPGGPNAGPMNVAIWEGGGSGWQIKQGKKTFEEVRVPKSIYTNYTVVPIQLHLMPLITLPWQLFEGLKYTEKRS